MSGRTYHISSSFAKKTLNIASLDSTTRLSDRYRRAYNNLYGSLPSRGRNMGSKESASTTDETLLQQRVTVRDVPRISATTRTPSLTMTRFEAQCLLQLLLQRPLRIFRLTSRISLATGPPGSAEERHRIIGILAFRIHRWWRRSMSKRRRCTAGRRKW